MRWRSRATGSTARSGLTTWQTTGRAMVLPVPGVVVRDPLLPDAPDLRKVPDAVDDERPFRLAVERRERTPHERLSAPWAQVRKGA